MSLGNKKTEGGKGTNYPWQSKMLLGLDKILTALSTSGGTSFLAPQARTSTPLRVSNTTGTIPAGIYSYSFGNVGTVDVTLDGTIIKPGETVNFDAGSLNNTLVNSVPYNCVGGEVLILIIQ